MCVCLLLSRLGRPIVEAATGIGRSGRTIWPLCALVTTAVCVPVSVCVHVLHPMLSQYGGVWIGWLLSAFLLVISSVVSFPDKRAKSGAQIFMEVGLGGVIFPVRNDVLCYPDVAPLLF